MCHVISAVCLHHASIPLKKGYELMCLYIILDAPACSVGEKHLYLYCAASSHGFVNGIGTCPALVLAASNHLSRPGHFTCQAVVSSGKLCNLGAGFIKGDTGHLVK